MANRWKLTDAQLKRELDLSMLNFETTDQVIASREIIGQERAMLALDFGLSIKKKGYNIYVTGIAGTGRNSYSYSIAKKLGAEKETPKDWCYVYNFKKPSNPKAISLKPGEGSTFKCEVDNTIVRLKKDIQKAFTSRDYEERKNDILKQHEKKTSIIVEELNSMAAEYNFIFKETEKGLVSIPLVGDRPIREDEIENLSDEEIAKLREDSSKLSVHSHEIIRKIREVEEELRDGIKELNEEIAYDIVHHNINNLINIFNHNGKVLEFLQDMEDDLIKNINEFVEEDMNELERIVNKKKKDEYFFRRYEINLFIDNKSKKGAQVIRERNPNYYNLLGKIEYFNDDGIYKTEHTKIKAGAIHEANGGFLIIQAKDILSSLYAWEGLKRALATEEIRVENLSKGEIVGETIKPEAIPLDIKVIIIGDHYTYQLLYAYDEDFKKLFKIRADFDVEMERNEENISKFASFISCYCKSEKLKPFHKSAISKMVEYSSRLAEDQNKLSSRFNEIVEIIYEADAWADAHGAEIITRELINDTIKNKKYRNSKYEERLLELIKNGVILIDTDGWKIGEINGLAVLDSGQYTFGRPSKITVSTFVGKDGIINIERETGYSGSSYDKGVLILSGYLGERYANNKPLSLSASITFEQSYSLIDGDSASSTEIYALLSSLADLPINQAIAVTGSVNQKGIIQPIGGVNEKIEGYFNVCKIKGFKGNEGVIIPALNISNLMLDDEVIQAVKKGEFSIYGIKTIDEGIEILTGVPAGKRDEKGRYSAGTVNYLVEKKLESYASIYKKFE